MKDCENCIMNTICTYYDKERKKANGKCPGWRWFKKCWLILILCLLIAAGCSSMKASLDRIIVDPNTVTIEHYEASHETLLVDWERYGFSGQIKGFGRVGSSKTRVESEGAEIVEDATGIVDPLRKVMP